MSLANATDAGNVGGNVVSSQRAERGVGSSGITYRTRPSTSTVFRILANGLLFVKSP
jgi:hypothetical protein